mmetsp:Transcript_25312/g.58800  ORF Transcript_25312/g.58800 Transcript_25312/m.58800 type:complete len:341 (-) Transcript_25312:64-1086(-)
MMQGNAMPYGFKASAPSSAPRFAAAAMPWSAAGSGAAAGYQPGTGWQALSSGPSRVPPPPPATGALQPTAALLQQQQGQALMSGTPLTSVPAVPAPAQLQYPSAVLPVATPTAAHQSATQPGMSMAASAGQLSLIGQNEGMMQQAASAQAYQDAVAASAVAAATASAYQQIWAGYLSGVASTQAGGSVASDIQSSAGLGALQAGRRGGRGKGAGRGRTSTGPPKPKPPPALQPGLLNDATVRAMGLDKPVVQAAPPAESAPAPAPAPAPLQAGLLGEEVSRASSSSTSKSKAPPAEPRLAAVSKKRPAPQPPGLVITSPQPPGLVITSPPEEEPPAKKLA